MEPLIPAVQQWTKSIRLMTTPRLRRYCFCNGSLCVITSFMLSSGIETPSSRSRSVPIWPKYLPAKVWLEDWKPPLSDSVNQDSRAGYWYTKAGVVEEQLILRNASSEDFSHADVCRWAPRRESVTFYVRGSLDLGLDFGNNATTNKVSFNRVPWSSWWWLRDFTAGGKLIKDVHQLASPPEEVCCAIFITTSYFPTKLKWGW